MNCLGKKYYAKQKLEEAYRDLGELFLRFLDVSAGYVLHTNEKLAFGQKRLYRYYEESAKSLNKTLNFYAADGDGDREAVDISLFVYEKRLAGIGVDLKSLNSDLAKDYKDKLSGMGLTKAVRKKARSRLSFLERVELSVNAYHAATLWYLYEDYGFAAGRLPDIYRELRRLYNDFSVAYINSTSVGDEIMRLMIKSMQDELEKVGILFNDDIKMLKNKTEVK